MFNPNKYFERLKNIEKSAKNFSDFEQFVRSRLNYLTRVNKKSSKISSDLVTITAGNNQEIIVSGSDYIIIEHTNRVPENDRSLWYSIENTQFAYTNSSWKKCHKIEKIDTTDIDRIYFHNNNAWLSATFFIIFVTGTNLDFINDEILIKGRTGTTELDTEHIITTNSNGNIETKSEQFEQFAIDRVFGGTSGTGGGTVNLITPGGNKALRIYGVSGSTYTHPSMARMTFRLGGNSVYAFGTNSMFPMIANFSCPLCGIGNEILSVQVSVNAGVVWRAWAYGYEV